MSVVWRRVYFSVILNAVKDLRFARDPSASLRMTDITSLPSTHYVLRTSFSSLTQLLQLILKHLEPLKRVHGGKTDVGDLSKRFSCSITISPRSALVISPNALSEFRSMVWTSA